MTIEGEGSFAQYETNLQTSLKLTQSNFSGVLLVDSELIKHTLQKGSTLTKPFTTYNLPFSQWEYTSSLLIIANFNPDLSKQAQEVIFSRKTAKVSDPSITFNTTPIARTACQKHLGLYLDEKLNFHDDINAKILKANKGIGIIKRLSNEYPSQKVPFNYLQIFHKTTSWLLWHHLWPT